MSLPQRDSVAEAITRIWARINANSADLGDLFERITESFYSKVVR